MRPRIRTIKPEFFKHERLFDLEKETGLPMRLAWAGLWTVADREGRFQWRPRAMKADILPYDTDIDFAAILEALKSAKMVIQYEINGEQFGWIPSFGNHQVINNRESKSELPPHPKEREVLACLTRGGRVDDAASVEGKGSEGKGSEVGDTPPAAQFAPPGGEVGKALVEIMANGRIQEVSREIHVDTFVDWLTRYETKSVRETLLNGINHYSAQNKNLRIVDIPRIGALLTAWVKNEKKTLRDRKAARASPPPTKLEPVAPPTTADIEAARAECERRGLKLAIKTLEPPCAG